MTKEETIAYFKERGNSVETTKSIIHIINQLDKDTFSLKEGEKIRKGDIFINKVVNKNRPMVVIRAGEDVSWCIGLTCSSKKHAIVPYTSRFLEDGSISTLVNTVENEKIRENYIGMFEDKKSLNEAIKYIKSKISKI